MSRPGSGLVRAILIALVGAVLLPLVASAQAVTGTISGSVADSQGQVIPGATVDGHLRSH